MAFTLPDPGPPNLDFERPADRAHLERTAAALTARGFKAQVADTRERARQLVLGAIPGGSEVHIALSETMREIGITEEIDESGRYDSIRARLSVLDRETQGREMRKIGAAPDYREFLRMQDIGYPGSLLAKTLIIHHEPSARITVILVPETLGF
jgi:hypothetical protein